MPVSRQQFDEIRRRVAETAPPGLSKIEFDALVFAEADKVDPSPEMRAASNFDETGGQKAIRLAKEWGPMAAATAATLPLGGVAGWTGLAARMAAGGGAAGLTKLATGGTPSEAATTGALYAAPELAGGALRALRPIGKRLYGFATKGTGTILKDAPKYAKTGDPLAARQQIQDTLAEVGYPLPTVKGVRKLQEAIWDRLNAVTEAVETAGTTMPAIPRKEVVARGMKEPIQEWIKSTAVNTPGLRQIASYAKAFAREAPRKLDLPKALERLRGINKRLEIRSPWTPATAEELATSGIARGLRKSLGERVPAIRALNEQVSRLIPAREALLHGAALDVTRAPASIPEFVSLSGMRPGTFFIAGLNRPIVAAGVGKTMMATSEAARKLRAEHLMRLLLAQAEGSTQ